MRLSYPILVLTTVLALVAPPAMAAVKGIMPGMAEGGVVNVKSGVTTPIRMIANCEAGLGQGSAASEHGAVTFKEMVGKACGNERQPVLLISYTSKPGFVGTDDVTVYAGPFPIHFSINVH